MEQEEKILKRLLKKKLPPGTIREELEQMKVAATYDNAIWLQLVKKAAGGDLSAAKYIREAVAENKVVQPEEDQLQSMSTEALRRLLNMKQGE